MTVVLHGVGDERKAHRVAWRLVYLTSPRMTRARGGTRVEGLRRLGAALNESDDLRSRLGDIGARSIDGGDAD